MSIIKEIVQNKKSHKYEYGCTMLYFDFPLINKVHDAIDPNDIYEDENDPTFGLETEPHTTLLFGTHEGVPLDNIKQVLSKYQFNTCKIHNASLFKNDKYDVLKFDVQGDSLHQCNADLKQFPYTSNFPDYHPHLTVAYLKPGKGDRYANMLKNQEWELVPHYAVYSEPNGTKTKIPIHVYESKSRTTN